MNNENIRIKEFKKRHFTFVLILCLAVLSEVLDLSSTLYINPSFNTSSYIYETNYWVNLFSLGFKGLIGVIALYFLFNMSCFIYSNYFFSISYPPSKETFLQRTIYYCIGNQKQFKSIFAHFFKSVLNFCGYYYIRCSIIMKFFWSLNNLMLGFINHNCDIVVNENGNEIFLHAINWEYLPYKISLSYFKWISSFENGNEILFKIIGFIVSVILIILFFRKHIGITANKRLKS